MKRPYPEDEAEVVHSIYWARAPKQDRGMTGLELDYGNHLDALRTGGAIADWFLKPIRLRIGRAAQGRNNYYTPDFMVQLLDGTLELHETKGHWREAARVRIKTAADMYPFILRAVTRDAKTGLWVYETISVGAPDWLESVVEVAVEPRGG